MCIHFILDMNTYESYGRCPNTETLGNSETINPTKKCVMNKIFIII